MSKFIEQLRLANKRRGQYHTDPSSAGITFNRGNNISENAEFSVGANKIKVSEFCGLSKEAKLLTWLQITVPELYEDFVKSIAISTSCRANIEKMHKLLEELIIRGKSDSLLDFLKAEYPNVIKRN